MEETVFDNHGGRCTVQVYDGCLYCIVRIHNPYLDDYQDVELFEDELDTQIAILQKAKLQIQANKEALEIKRIEENDIMYYPVQSDVSR